MMKVGRAALGWIAAVVMLACGVAAACVLALNRLDEAPLAGDAVAAAAAPEVVARGEYLARVGNCISCHTSQGGSAYAGGRAINTPYGLIYAPNLTPDDETGLGRWTAGEFWRAMHNGRSRDGRLLYPAFPYPHYTHITRADSDAIYGYLRNLPPVAQASPAHALRFPFNTQAALVVWRALFFRPGGLPEQSAQSPEWNRGAYLVQGLGHCAACHTPRNAWGASRANAPFGGGLMPGQNWYAPALNTAHEAGVSHWALEDVTALLRNGVSAQATVSGPMAEVVFRSLQYLNDADVRAMAVYLQGLQQGQGSGAVLTPLRPAAAGTLARGGEVYQQQCAQCHGKQGEGRGAGLPALAANRAVMLGDMTNLVQVVLHGGYSPATRGNPRPYGMPPFMQSLSDEEIADVLTYIRNAWGNQASKVDTIDIHRARERRGS